MPKIIVAFFILTIGMVVWALQPAPKKTPEPTTTEVSAPSVDTPATWDNPPIKRRIAKDRVKKAPSKKTNAQATNIPRRPHAELVREREEFQKMSESARAHRSAVPPGAKVNRPWPVYLPGEEQIDYDKNPAPKYERPKSESPFPAVATTAFKDSVRRYYGGLPAKGRAGMRIMAADVLPNAIIMGLQVPPNSELKMLGPFNMDHEKVFQNALETPDYGDVVFGVSYETPSGEQHRKYIRLEGEQVQ